jgi:hypothetical protein
MRALVILKMRLWTPEAIICFVTYFAASDTTPCLNHGGDSLQDRVVFFDVNALRTRASG